MDPLRVGAFGRSPAPHHHMATSPRSPSIATTPKGDDKERQAKADGYGCLTPCPLSRAFPLSLANDRSGGGGRRGRQKATAGTAKETAASA